MSLFGRRTQSRWEFGVDRMADLVAEAQKFKGESLGRDAWRRLRANRGAFYSLLFLILAALVSGFAPLLPIPSPKAIDFDEKLSGPRPFEFVRKGPWQHSIEVTFAVPENALEEIELEDERADNATSEAADENKENQKKKKRWRLTDEPLAATLMDRVREVSGPRGIVLDVNEEREVVVRAPLRPGDAPEIRWMPSEDRVALRVHRRRLDASSGASPYAIFLELEAPKTGEWSSVRGRIDGGYCVATWTFEDDRQQRLRLRIPDWKRSQVGGLAIDGVAIRSASASRADVVTEPVDRSDPFGFATMSIGAADDRAELGAPNQITVVGDDGAIRILYEVLEASVAVENGEPVDDIVAKIDAAVAQNPVVGAEYLGTQCLDAYWELNAFDQFLVDLRGRLFGLSQTGPLLGTDDKGRDMLSRIVWGSRTSILVAIMATLCSLVIGVTYGAVAGLLGGRVDEIMMRIVDILYSIPFIFVVIFLITLIGENSAVLEARFGLTREVVFYLVIGAIYWLTMARIVRGQVLSLRKTEFIEAARLIGASTPRILFGHIVPNVLSIVVVYLTLTIPAVMLFEAFLSFLGLGIEPPKVSWGVLATDSVAAINPLDMPWWLVVFPALAMGSVLLALNVLGDGLRDALDPRLRGKD